MNAMTKAEAPPAALHNPMMPQSMHDAMKLAELMSTGRLVPKHLQDTPGDCLMVIEQAMRWGMSPFAVAQSTSVISGKLMFEGKLVGAALNSSGILSARMTYEYSGEGATRKVVASATIKGMTKPSTVEVELANVKTTNGMWASQPDQQLAYSANRIWARRHAPEVMLGVYTPEEFDEQPRDNFRGVTVEATATASPVVTAPSEKTLQAVDGVINTLSGCEEPEEWLKLDDKWKAYREKLATNQPQLSAKVEAAFTEARTRLFPDPTDEPPPADDTPAPDTLRAHSLIADFQHATSKAELELVGSDAETKAWRDRMATEKPELFEQMATAYKQRAADFGRRR